MVVYVVTNKVNQKQYVGMTTRGLEVRKAQHLADARRGSEVQFHRAIRKYGEDSFEWGVVYVGSSESELFEKEIELIQELDTYNNGYNMTLGGECGSGVYGESHGQAVLTEEQVSRIGWLIQNTTMTYPEIAKETNCNWSNVSAIAFGNAWTYLFPTPPYLNRPHGARTMKYIEEEQAIQIVDMLHNTTMSYIEISLATGVDVSNISNIANGKSWMHLYEVTPRLNRPEGSLGGHSIRPTLDEEVLAVVDLITTTTKLYTEIADEIGVGITTVMKIANGKTHTHLYEGIPSENRPDGVRVMSEYRRLDEDRAKRAVWLLQHTTLSHPKIAEEVGTSRDTIKEIARGKIWKHLYDIPPMKVRKLRKKWRKALTDKYKIEIDWSEVS